MAADDMVGGAQQARGRVSLVFAVIRLSCHCESAQGLTGEVAAEACWPGVRRGRSSRLGQLSARWTSRRGEPKHQTQLAEGESWCSLSAALTRQRAQSKRLQGMRMMAWVFSSVWLFGGLLGQFVLFRAIEAREPTALHDRRWGSRHRSRRRQPVSAGDSQDAGWLRAGDA